MLFRNPLALPLLLLCIGIGIVVIRGQELKSMQDWTPADIDTAVELNMALDLARQGPDIEMSESEREARKAQIRQEIQKTFVEPQQKLRAEYKQGFWISGIGLVLLIIVLFLQQRGLLKKA